jgi:Zn-dependent protease
MLAIGYIPFNYFSHFGLWRLYMFSNEEIIYTLMIIPGILLGFVLHEFAHALMADRLGDPTPRSQGRITLNPRSHIDIIGFILILIFKIGWAKPVMTNPRNYRKPRRDDILVSIAGPFTNLLIAIAFILIMKIIDITGAFSSNADLEKNIFLMLYYSAQINVVLFVLNLLPFPNFDGYHVITNIFNTWKYRIFNILEQYGMIIFILLAMSGVLLRIIMPFVTIIFGYLMKVIL